MKFFTLTKPGYVRCKKCRNMEQKATGWDYQHCTICGTYYFDYRDTWVQLGDLN